MVLCLQVTPRIPVMALRKAHSGTSRHKRFPFLHRDRKQEHHTEASQNGGVGNSLWPIRGKKSSAGRYVMDNRNSSRTKENGGEVDTIDKDEYHRNQAIKLLGKRGK